jgi:hypothetical protein
MVITSHQHALKDMMIGKEKDSIENALSANLRVEH